MVYINRSVPADQLDGETDPRVQEDVNREQAAALHRIGWISYPVRQALNEDFREARHYGALYRDYAASAPSKRLNRLRSGAAVGRKVRASVDNASFDSATNAMTYHDIDALFTDAGGVQRHAKVSVNFNHPHWKDRERSAAELQAALADHTEKELRDDYGIEVRAADPKHALPSGDIFQPNQAMEAARRIASLMSLAAAVGHGGVSSPNAALAIDFARQLPLPELLKLAANDTTKIDEEIRKAEIKTTLIPLLERLNQYGAQEVDDATADDQLKKIARDSSTNMRDGQTVESDVMRELIPSPHTHAAATTLTAQQVAGYRSVLSSAKEKFQKIRDNYKKMQEVLGDLHRVLSVPGVTMPLAMTNRGVTSTGVSSLSLTTTLNPKDIVSELRTQMEVPATLSITDANKTLEDLRKKKEESPGEKLAGADLVKKIYTTYFQRERGLSESAAEKRAETMYAENALTRDEIKYAEEMVRTEEVVGRPPVEGTDHVVNVGRQALFGRDKSFVCNLVSGINRNMVSGLSHFMGIAAPWAHPKWGKGSAKNLMEAYYALRQAIRDGDVWNTHYVTKHMKAIQNELVLPKYTNELWEAAAKMPKEERDRLSALPVHERNLEIVKTLLGQDTPPEYLEGVKKGLSTARTWTAPVRKFVGRKIIKPVATFTGNVLNPVARARNVFLGKGAGWNPLTWPARTVRGTGRAIGGFFGAIHNWGKRVS
jgi:hypothetical protein